MRVHRYTASEQSVMSARGDGCGTRARPARGGGGGVAGGAGGADPERRYGEDRRVQNSCHGQYGDDGRARGVEAGRRGCVPRHRHPCLSDFARTGRTLAGQRVTEPTPTTPPPPPSR